VRRHQARRANGLAGVEQELHVDVRRHVSRIPQQDERVEERPGRAFGQEPVRRRLRHARRRLTARPQARRRRREIRRALGVHRLRGLHGHAERAVVQLGIFAGMNRQARQRAHRSRGDERRLALAQERQREIRGPVVRIGDQQVRIEEALRAFAEHPRLRRS
jgi:hypothetical protein